MPRAPHTLVPRVLAAVLAQLQRPWYERPWVNWPRSWQAVSLVAFVALLVGVGTLELVLERAAVVSTPGVLGDAASQVTRVAEVVSAAANGLAVLRRTLVQPVLGYVVGLLVLMYVVCAALGAALARFTLGGESLS